MVIKPKVRGFICTTTHPVGCEAHVQEQIALVKKDGPIANGPKKVLVIGASTGYGLAARIAAAFGANAATIGVFLEKPGTEKKPGSAGWYNSAAFEKAAHAEGSGGGTCRSRTGGCSNRRLAMGNKTETRNDQNNLIPEGKPADGSFCQRK